MAERRVSTRFAVEGEAQYKAAVKNINSELKVLDSELKVANSSLKANGASIDTLKAKQQALENVISKLNEKLNASKAQMDKARQAQADWAAKAADARQRMEQLAASTDEAGKETDDYKNQMAQLQAEINRYEAAEQKATDALRAHATEANNTEAKLNKFEGELRDTAKALKEMNDAAEDGGDGLDDFGDGADDASDAVTELAQALAAAGVVASIKEIAEALMECVDASIEFESAMAGVAKTTNLSGDDLAQMGDTFKQMSTEMPIAATELAQIAEVAGQLGVPVRNLESFTKVMAQLATATNMTSEEAATMIAQFAAITGMDLTNVDRLGASIVALGNNFATNERRITDMSQSIAGAATNAGMAETDMLGLSTAVTSLGIEAAMGGTNMSKLISEMQSAVQSGKDLDTWASAAGMSAAEFSVLWGQDATGALLAFVKGLGSMGGEMNGVLDTLGIGEQRFKRMITSLANAEDANGMLTRALQLSNTAWKENSALVKEAETRYETTESKVTMYKNSVQNLRTAIGDQLTPALGDLASTGKDVTEWATGVVEDCPELVSLVITLTTAAGSFLLVLVGLRTAVPLVVKAFTALQAVIVANPWMLTAAAIAAVVAAMAALAISSGDSNSELAQTNELLKQTKESATNYQETVDGLQAEATATDGLVTSLLSLVEQENKTAGQKAVISGLVDELNSKLPELNLHYDELNDTLNLTSEQIKAVAQEMANQAKMEADVKRLSELYGEQAGISEQLEDAQAQLTAAKEKYKDATVDETTGLLFAGDVCLGYGDDLMFAQQQVDRLTQAQQQNQEAIDGISTAYDEAAEAQSAYTEDEEGLITYLEEATTRVQELMTQFQAMGEAAVQGAEQTAGGLLNVVEVVESSSADVIAALQSQTEFFNQYAENIKAAAENGLSEGLVAALSDGSMESAQILAGLASEGWANVQELNEAFAATQEGKAALEQNVTEANATASTELQAIVDNVNKMVDEFNQSGEASEAGVETINAYVDGLNSNLAGVSSTVDSINGEINRIIRHAEATVTIRTVYVGGKSSHAAGLSYVPYDEYPASLHKGEMVLTALQARVLRAEQNMNNHVGRSVSVMQSAAAPSTTTNIRQGNKYISAHVHFDKDVVIRGESDIDKLATIVAEKLGDEYDRKESVFK